MKKRTTRCSLIVAVLSVVLFSGADWFRFRGSDTSGVSGETALPTTWSETENIVWKTPLPGFGSSSPIVLGENIFLTAYSGYGFDSDEPGDQKDLKLHVLCIDRTTGKILWDKTAETRLPETEYDGGYVRLHGYASATPVTDGKAVYTFFGRSGVQAYSLDGELLWEASVGDGLDKRGWGSGASPILAADLVIVNASIESESLVALNKTTGKEVWRAEGIVDSWSTPALVDLPDAKQELVVSMHSKVRGYDPATGKQLWECASVEDYVVPAVVVDRGGVYVTG
ncbi:MAG: PQQ-binding-like beta-propeller repeat protein, partial [Candidatus Nealsonbacteria bacterium]|nr:PQQ-binding-like beta-propeller repeat protein [Candidatus Nealsonbacteria bacterium]